MKAAKVGRKHEDEQHLLWLVIHALPVPFRAALPNAAFKCRLGHKKLPFTGGSVGQLPHLEDYQLALTKLQVRSD
jgi:hypothetical protein